ncbi:hypothetical protein Plhal304r1_c013g0050111 [Plasmopara halstedii]
MSIFAWGVEIQQQSGIWPVKGGLYAKKALCFSHNALAGTILSRLHVAALLISHCHSLRT